MEEDVKSFIERFLSRIEYIKTARWFLYFVYLRMQFKMVPWLNHLIVV